MSLVKALIMGAVLTLIVSGAIGAAHYSGGYLNIREFQVSGHFVHWSWPLFVASTGGVWALLLMMK